MNACAIQQVIRLVALRMKLPISKADVAAVKNDQTQFERLVHARSAQLSEALHKDPNLSLDADMLVQYVDREHGCVEGGTTFIVSRINISDVTWVVADLYGVFVSEKRKVNPHYGDNLVVAREKLRLQGDDLRQGDLITMG